MRIEELLNYFDYSYAPPHDLKQAFAIHTELAPSPGIPENMLLHIGIKGYEVPQTQVSPANLVFLIDVSGSMADADKLPLLVQSLKLLTEKLGRQDRISIAVYAGAAGTMLTPTAGDEKDAIFNTLDWLSAGGSTQGAQGILLAYELAGKALGVKIQVEFNPAQVVEYRLIGYENRVLQNEDFNNDQVDAGDIGAGQCDKIVIEKS